MARDTEYVVGCSKCGRLDSTLSGSVFKYAVSGVFVTFRHVGSQGVFCAACRRKEAIKWSLMTGVLGWWGIPWGPIFTVQILIQNARSSRQEPAFNAALLAATGQALADQGQTSEAIRALERAARIKRTPQVEQQLSQLRGY